VHTEPRTPLSGSSLVGNFLPQEWFFHFARVTGPDKAPLDCALLNKVKETRRGRKFPTNYDPEGGVRGSVRSVPKDGTLLLPESYQRDGNGAQTLVGSMSNMLQCDVSPVVSRRLVTPVSVSHLWTTLVHKENTMFRKGVPFPSSGEEMGRHLPSRPHKPSWPQSPGLMTKFCRFLTTTYRERSCLRGELRGVLRGFYPMVGKELFPKKCFKVLCF
jgi:hypothetical protein